jgi:hypothetical protein
MYVEANDARPNITYDFEQPNWADVIDDWVIAFLRSRAQDMIAPPFGNMFGFPETNKLQHKTLGVH